MTLLYILCLIVLWVKLKTDNYNSDSVNMLGQVSGYSITIICVLLLINNVFFYLDFVTYFVFQKYFYR